MSAPRMVLQQYIDKWFPDDPADLPRMSDRAIKKLLLDVSVFLFFLLGRVERGCCWM